MKNVRGNRAEFTGKYCSVEELRAIGWSKFDVAEPCGLTTHTHGDAYEICFIKRGTTEWQVGSERFQLLPGDIFLTKPHELHGGINDVMHPCELYWVQFCLDITNGAFAIAPSLAENIDFELRRFSCRQAKANKTIEQHFSRILESHLKKDDYSIATINASMQLLLISVINSLVKGQSVPRKENNYSERIQAAHRIIEDNISTELPISLIAERLGLGLSQFRYIFRKETGFSPVEYINNYRIKLAAGLLTQSKKSVTDIAFEVGFQSTQYFAIRFKKATGVSPSQYRNSI